MDFHWKKTYDMTDPGMTDRHRNKGSSLEKEMWNDGSSSEKDIWKKGT